MKQPTDLIDNELVVAEAFVTARRGARPLASYPGSRPTDLAAAYRIQDAAMRFDGRPVGAWKVGRINPPFDLQFGEDRLVALVDTHHDAGPVALLDRVVAAVTTHGGTQQYDDLTLLVAKGR